MMVTIPAHSVSGPCARFAWGSAAVLALLVPHAQAGVVIVTGSGSALASAVTAAADGDTLLVLNGTYDGFTLDGKGLSIVADTGATATVGSLTILSNIPAGHDTILSGLHFNGGLRVLGCACAVRVQAVSSTGYSGPPGVAGISLAGDSDVALVRCTLDGASGDYIHPTGGRGIDAQLSTFALYDCSLLGGGGVPHNPQGTGPGAGGDGLNALDSIVMASNCSISGGPGGFGGYYSCHGAAGGNGLVFYGTGSVPADCYLRDCSEHGGSGGYGTCGNGADGAPLGVFGAGLYYFPAAHRQFEAECPVREAAAIQLVFHGAPGDRVDLYYSPSTRFELSHLLEGTLLYGTNARTATMGTIPAGGTLNARIRVADLGAGVEASTRYLQAVFTDSAGQATLGSPVSLVILDSAF